MMWLKLEWATAAPVPIERPKLQRKVSTIETQVYDSQIGFQDHVTWITQVYLRDINWGALNNLTVEFWPVSAVTFWFTYDL